LDLGESLRNLLKALYAASPAYNELTQMLFILPEKAFTLLKMYPEIMEKEDVLREVVGIRYSEDGYINPTRLGGLLAELYYEFFKILSHPVKRKRLLEAAGLKEEDFKGFDPLRSWIEVSFDFLSKISKDSLKLLSVIIGKMLGKRPDESVSWEEVKKEAAGINFEEAQTLLKRFYLIPYSSSYSIYAYECPLLLDAYSDLREKLKELLG